jgi:hypothetical protein
MTAAEILQCFAAMRQTASPDAANQATVCFNELLKRDEILDPLCALLHSAADEIVLCYTVSMLTSYVRARSGHLSECRLGRLRSALLDSLALAASASELLQQSVVQAIETLCSLCGAPWPELVALLHRQTEPSRALLSLLSGVFPSLSLREKEESFLHYAGLAQYFLRQPGWGDRLIAVGFFIDRIMEGVDCAFPELLETLANDFSAAVAADDGPALCSIAKLIARPLSSRIFLIPLEVLLTGLIQAISSSAIPIDQKIVLHCLLAGLLGDSKPSGLPPAAWHQLFELEILFLRSGFRLSKDDPVFDWASECSFVLEAIVDGLGEAAVPLVCGAFAELTRSAAPEDRFAAIFSLCFSALPPSPGFGQIIPQVFDLLSDDDIHVADAAALAIGALARDFADIDSGELEFMVPRMIAFASRSPFAGADLINEFAFHGHTAMFAPLAGCLLDLLASPDPRAVVAAAHALRLFVAGEKRGVESDFCRQLCGDVLQRLASPSSLMRAELINILESIACAWGERLPELLPPIISAALGGLSDCSGDVRGIAAVCIGILCRVRSGEWINDAVALLNAIVAADFDDSQAHAVKTLVWIGRHLSTVHLPPLIRCCIRLIIDGSLPSAVIAGEALIDAYELDADREFTALILEGAQNFVIRVLTQPPPDASRITITEMLDYLLALINGQNLEFIAQIRQFADGCVNSRFEGAKALAIFVAVVLDPAAYIGRALEFVRAEQPWVAGPAALAFARLHRDLILEWIDPLLAAFAERLGITGDEEQPVKNAIAWALANCALRLAVAPGAGRVLRLLADCTDVKKPAYKNAIFRAFATGYRELLKWPDGAAAYVRAMAPLLAALPPYCTLSTETVSCGIGLQQALECLDDPDAALASALRGNMQMVAFCQDTIALAAATWDQWIKNCPEEEIINDC